jgi:hypothetical protein
MPTVIMTAKLEKPFADWVKVFDNHKPAREAAGIRAIYRGHQLDAPDTIHVLMSVPSMAVMEAFIAEHGETIKNSGHNVESTKVTVCSD